MNGFQRAMIVLARSQRIGGFMGAAGSKSGLAARFVGGADADAAARTAASLRERHGIRASLFYLGEYVTDPAAIDENVSQVLRVISALRERGLDLHVSVDPTAIGYMHSDSLGERNARRMAGALADAGNTSGNCLMLDMEDLSIRDKTCALHRSLMDSGLPVALTLQARRRRTRDDLRELVVHPTTVRLVKGAFPADATHDFQGKSAIDSAYMSSAECMLSAEALESGFYPVFGTHDDRIALAVVELARRKGWPVERFEFEMLYGVRPAWQLKLRKMGYRVRVYLPFGEDWWPYAIRRVGENPRNAWLLFRAMRDRDGYGD